ncbi:hypothetical protein AX16_006959 [Volvariella volvacea WC 439]|nr:hypothetical protein AX16_006959 [Volvariella volvacea WC 439]
MCQLLLQLNHPRQPAKPRWTKLQSSSWRKPSAIVQRKPSSWIATSSKVRLSSFPPHNERGAQSLHTYTSIDDEGVAPGLVAAKEKLKRSQLEDKLEHALQQRPKAEDLVKEGILNGEHSLLYILRFLFLIASYPALCLILPADLV